MSDAPVSIREKHPRPLRWLHWLNLPILAVMVWSGILIYWAHQPYLRIPPSVARALGIEYHLAEGMAWHFTVMWLFLLNGFLYLIHLATSGEWRELRPDRRSWSEALQVVRHDLGFSKELPPLRGKFNGAQRIAYSSVILAGAGLALSGFAIYKPVQLGWLTALFGGYEGARLVHFLLMCFVILFFVVHVAQVIRAGWNNFRAMVAGYEIERK